MNRYYTDDPHRKVSGGPKWKQNSAGESPSVVVQLVKTYPVQMGLSKGSKKSKSHKMHK